MQGALGTGTGRKQWMSGSQSLEDTPEWCIVVAVRRDRVARAVESVAKAVNQTNVPIWDPGYACGLDHFLWQPHTGLRVARCFRYVALCDQKNADFSPVAKLPATTLAALR